MPCSKESKQCPTTHDYTPLPECCKDKVFSTLNYITDLCDKNDIKYWLDYGSLLGASRNGKFIPWDRDTDISIPEIYKDKFIGLLDQIIADGYFYKWKIWRGHKGCHCKITYSSTNDRHTCVFFWFDDNGMMRREKYIGLLGVNTDAKKGRDFPKVWVDELTKIPFEGKLYNVPKDYKKFCEFRYGKAWKKPLNIADWNSKVINEDNRVSKYSSEKLINQLEVAPVIGKSSKEITNGIDYIKYNRFISVDYGLKMAEKLCDGSYLKFGVNSGKVADFIRSKIEDKLYLFDVKNTIPNIPITYIGEYSNMLNLFNQHVDDKRIKFIHMDNTDYRSAYKILEALKRIIGNNKRFLTIIVFDEFYNYNGYDKQSYRAFDQFTKLYKQPYRVLAKTYHQQVIIQLW
jgi:hypothetical protein